VKLFVKGLRAGLRVIFYKKMPAGFADGHFLKFKLDSANQPTVDWEFLNYFLPNKGPA